MKEKNQKLFESLSEIGGELVLDSQLTEGLLKEIPIVKTVFAIYKSGKSIRDTLYLRKLKMFLENMWINTNKWQKAQIR